MKKIIVTTDFSKASETAARYGAWLAERLSAKLEIVHVVEIDILENTLRNWRAMEMQLVASAKARATQLIESISNPVEITYRHLNGSPFHEIISQYAVDSKADLVVIGSQGASGIKKLFGSNAARLINDCPIPVLVVPAQTSLKDFKKIAYATDMTHLDDEIKTIMGLARPFDAEVDILHITNDDAQKRDRTNLREIIRRIADYDKIDFKVISYSAVADGINEALTSIKPDLLAMFTHQRDITDRIFGKGVTRELALNNQLPLLVINRTTSRG